MTDAPSGALPRYQQISELLIRDIAAGRLLDGARLAPERDMASDLGVAVGTLRKALQDLADKGLLERVHGSGNYIRALPEVDSIYALFRLELLAGGGLPSAKVLDVARCPKPVHLPNFGSAADAHRIRRLRLLSGQPVAVEEIWLDGAYARELHADELSQSLYLHYRMQLGLWIARAEDRIGTGLVPDFAPAAFGLRPGAIGGHILRISWGQDNQRAEVSETWFDPNVAQYVSRLK